MLSSDNDFCLPSLCLQAWLEDHGRLFGHFIDNKWVKPADCNVYENKNPATGKESSSCLTRKLPLTVKCVSSLTERKLQSICLFQVVDDAIESSYKIVTDTFDFFIMKL